MADSRRARKLATKELGDYLIKLVDELAKTHSASQEPLYFRDATPRTMSWPAGNLSPHIPE
jgi:hypothetical protein